MKWLGVLSLPTPFGTDPQVIRPNSVEPQMLTPGVKLRPQEVPPLCLPSATWIVRLLTVWLLLPQQVLEQVPMVLLEQFHVSKQCVVININAEFTMLLSACHFINQPTHLPVSLCSYVFLLVTILCLHSSIRLSTSVFSLEIANQVVQRCKLS